jgi:uncharacterized protein YukE
MTGRRTDFAAVPHPELVRMLLAGNPDDVVAAGDVWAAAGTSLHDRALDLEQRLNGFDTVWTGSAADQYQAMISDLSDGIRQVATTVLTVRDLTYSAGEALRAARTGVAAAGAAQGTAAQVMAALADRYVSIETAIPPLPSAATRPAVAGGPSIAGGPSADGAPDGPPLEQATTGGAGAPVPRLFSGVFAAGLAAAAAALGGRFSGVLTNLTRRRTATATTGDPESPGSPEPGPKPGGGGGGSAPKLGGGADLGPGTPVVNPALNASSAASGGVAAGPAIGTGGGPPGLPGTPTAGGMMPGMPYGMMGAGDAGIGGGRRIPAWLVETEDVWGERSEVAPTVIGEESAQPPETGTSNWPFG